MVWLCPSVRLSVQLYYRKINYHWKINGCVGRLTVLMEDKLYYWKINCDIGRSVVFSGDQLYWRQSTRIMVHTGLEKSWNLTLDLKSHGILCWPGKMAFCLEKSLKISGCHWQISCAKLNLIWTWKHWWLYDKKYHFVITFETILVKPCLQTCIAELLVTLLQISESLLHCSS